MHVLHVIRSMDPATGGPIYAVEEMVKILGKHNVAVDVATTVPLENDKTGLSNTPIIRNGVRFFHFP